MLAIFHSANAAATPCFFHALSQNDLSDHNHRIFYRIIGTSRGRIKKGYVAAAGGPEICLGLGHDVSVGALLDQLEELLRQTF
jgi:hypothetical protein